MSRRLWLVVALVCSFLFCPDSAYAEDGFIGGLQDFAGVREVEQSEVKKPSNEPRLNAVVTPRPELPEDADMLDYIKYFIQTANRVPVNLAGTQGYSLIDESEWLLRVVVVPLAVLLAFMWWGVRKSLSMIMSAWRKGKQSV